MRGKWFYLILEINSAPIEVALNYDKHHSAICIKNYKVSKNIVILYKLRSALAEKHVFIIYNSLILPCIHYCGIVWTGVGTSKLNPIHKLQRKLYEYAPILFVLLHHFQYSKEAKYFKWNSKYLVHMSCM